MTIRNLPDGYRATVKINGKNFVADLRTSGEAKIPELIICRAKCGRVSQYDRGNPAYSAYPEAVSQATLKKHIFLFAMTNP